MKRILTLALIALSIAAAVSCKKDKGNNSIEGTWLMRWDGSHYFDATFKKDGSYEWLWQGAAGLMKDTGKYTFQNNVITMTPSKYYREDWSNEGQLIEYTAEDFEWSGPRTVYVLENHGSYAFWKWEGDHLLREAENIPMFRKGAKNVKSSDMKGTWEGVQYDEKIRYVFDGTNFAEYGIAEATESQPLHVGKRSGTYTVEDNIITLSFKKSQRSFKHLGGTNYTWYTVDPQTYESDQWETFDVDFNSKYYVFIADKKLYMESLVLTKK